MTEVPRWSPDDFKDVPIGPEDTYHEPYPGAWNDSIEARREHMQAAEQPVVLFESEVIQHGEIVTTTVDSADPYHEHISRSESYNHSCG